MPTVLNWPERGEWLLSNPKSPIGHNASGFYRKVDPPFAVLTVYFKTKIGTVRSGRTTVNISGVQLRQTKDGPKFIASYAIGKHSGQFEATVLDKYELEIEFTGTAVTSVNAHPTEIIGADKDVASLSTQDKLQEAIRRALPLMPEEVAREVEAVFTPQAIAMMATFVGLWAAAQSNPAGWAADILLLTGALILMRMAHDVGTDLAAFIVGATGATTDEDLDKAARHFAAAVLKGGVLLVSTMMMSNRPRRARTTLKGPARPGQPVSADNMVPPARIPPPSRAVVTPQGQQPRLAGLTEEVAQLVRGLLNKIREADLAGKGIDCCEGSQRLNVASGGKGIVTEGTSGASGPAGLSDHTMWEIGDEFVDTRPGWWKDLFKTNPGARAVLERIIPGLPQRLETGAVLTRAEHTIYQSGAPTPRSNMFDGKPIPRRPGE